MGRCDLYAAGSEFLVNILVGNHRDLAVRQRKLQHFSDQVLVTLVIRVDRHGGIAEQCLRTGGCDLDKSSLLTHDRVVDVPEEAVLLLMLNLSIGNGCLADRTPVDDPGSLVDISFFIKA